MASAVSLLLIYVSQAVTLSLIMIIICNTALTIHGTNSLFSSLNTKDLNKCPQDKQWFCFNSTVNQAEISDYNRSSWGISRTAHNSY